MRLAKWGTSSLRHWGRPPQVSEEMAGNAALDCGWGRLIFGQTFRDHRELAEELQSEATGKRNIAMYVRDHHVLLSRAPDQLFVDPSDTYRLWLHLYRPPKRSPRGFQVRLLQDTDEAAAMNHICAACGMMETPPDLVMEHQKTRVFTYFVAVDNNDGALIGTILGIDHKEAFGDPDNGSSFWCLATDLTRRRSGVGRALVSVVAEHYLARGRQYLDLSVLHDNKAAIRLYRKMGFRRVPVYAVKCKNDINREYYTGPEQPADADQVAPRAESEAYA